MKNDIKRKPIKIPFPNIILLISLSFINVGCGHHPAKYDVDLRNTSENFANKISQIYLENSNLRSKAILLEALDDNAHSSDSQLAMNSKGQEAIFLSAFVRESELIKQGYSSSDSQKIVGQEISSRELPTADSNEKASVKKMLLGTLRP
ncbi:MAG: hypothetical protein ABL933_09010 [Methyloglobulus sp.]|nr:hypothetical protein [Methyloglobulus sp.]